MHSLPKLNSMLVTVKESGLLPTMVVFFLVSPVYSDDVPVQHEPIDKQTRQVVVGSCDLSEMGVDSLILGDLISLDFTGQAMKLTSESFAKFKREAYSEAFPNDHFVIQKRKGRINIYCKKDYIFGPRSRLIPNLLFYHTDVGNAEVISFEWIWRRGVHASSLMNMAPDIFSQFAVIQMQNATEVGSKTTTIAKIAHNVSVPQTQLLARVGTPMVLPRPVFSIGETDYIGEREFEVELQLDSRKSPRWASYTPAADESYILDENKLTIKIPSELLASDYSFTLGQLELLLEEDWEGYLPLQGIVRRNYWENRIDLSKIVEIGKLEVDLVNPAILHPQFPGERNYSKLNINIGSHVLVKKGDSFLLELSTPIATRFSRKITSNPDRGGYEIEVVDKNSCRIVLLQDPMPRSSISLEELPLEVSQDEATTGLIVTYPWNLGQHHLMKPVIVVPEVDTLHYFSSPVILLPEIPFNEKTQDDITAAVVILLDGDVMDLTEKIFRQGLSRIPKVKVSLENREKEFYVDYLLEHGSRYRAWRRIVNTGRVELRARSPSEQPWRVLSLSDKPQSLPKIQIIDERKILQPGDSLIFNLPMDIDVVWATDYLQDEKAEIKNKSFVALYGTDFAEELDPPSIIIKKHSPSTFIIGAEVRTNYWRKSLPVKGSIMIGAPDITVDETKSFILFRQTNRLPTIVISDDYGFLRKGDQLLLDFYFEDGTPVDFPTRQPELTMNVNGYVIRRDNEKLNRFLLTIPEVSGSPPDLEINGLLTGVITDKNHKFISMEVGIKGFKDVIKDFEPVVRSAQPGLKFQRFGGLWVANDGVSPDLVQIEYHDDEVTRAFTEPFNITISVPLTSAALWDTTSSNHVIPSDFSGNIVTVRLDPESVSNGTAVIGDYSLVPSGMVGSEFRFEYEFESVSQVYSSDSVFVLHKPAIDIVKDRDVSQRHDIYVFQSDSIRLSIPIITYTEESKPLLKINDLLALKWSSPSWTWSEMGTYDTGALTLLNPNENSNELRFRLTTSIPRGQTLHFRDFEILYGGRPESRTDSLLTTISKPYYDYVVSATTKLITSYHDILLEPDTLVWSRNQIRSPQFLIRGSSGSVISPERDIVLRLGGSYSSPTWKGNYRREAPNFVVQVDSDNPALLYLTPKKILDEGTEIKIPSIPLENIQRDVGDITVEISFDGGENYPVNRTLVHVAQPSLISSDSDWRLLRSSKPQPLTPITVVDGSDYSCFGKGDSLSIILPQEKLVTFLDETLESVSFSSAAKNKVGQPILSEDRLKMSIPIIETFDLLESLEINGLLVKSENRTANEEFYLKFSIKGDANYKAPPDQVYIDQKKIAISQIDVQVAQSQVIYSLLESAFEIPAIRIRDDPEAPFFSKGDRLRLKFDKPKGYYLAFNRENLRDFSSHQIQVFDDAIEILVVSELHNEEIGTSRIFFKKPSAPMGLNTLRCEIVKAGTSDMKPFFLDIPLKIAFSSDVPSFELRGNKEFLVNNVPTQLPALVIHEDSLLQTLKRGSEILARLPVEFKGAWNESSIERIRLSGSAPQKIRNVQYQDSSTFLIKVREDFLPGDSVIFLGAKVEDVSEPSQEWHELTLDLNHPDGSVKHFKKRSKSGSIRAGEIRLLWPREQNVVPSGIYDSKQLDPLKIVRNSVSPIDSLGITQFFLTLEPLEGQRRNAAEWDGKMTKTGPYKFQNDIFELNSLDRHSLGLRIEDRTRSQDLLVLSEQLVPELYLSGFKRNVNSEYRLVLRLEPDGPAIAQCPHKIVVDWQGELTNLENPFKKGKRIRLSVMPLGKGIFVDTENTEIVMSYSGIPVSKPPDVLLSNEISFELNNTIEKGTGLVIENVTFEFAQMEQDTVMVLPRIGVNPGFGVIPLVARQVMVVNTVANVVNIRKSTLSKDDEFTEGIFIKGESEEFKNGKLTFDLEFDVITEQDPEMTKINNFRLEVMKRFFSTVIPQTIPDVQGNQIISSDSSIILTSQLQAYGIGIQRWQYHYLKALILHFADDAAATDAYGRAKDLGYSAGHYNDWPPIEGRDSPENLVKNRVERVIELTNEIPNDFFLSENRNLDSEVIKNLENADDLLLSVQYYLDYMKFIKDHNLLADFYVAKIDLAIALGDLTEADRQLNFPGRDVTRLIRNSGRPDKSQLNKRKQKLQRLLKNEVVVAKKDYQGTSFLSKRDLPYRVVLEDQTGEDVKFRITSLNDRRLMNEKLRGDEDSTNLLAGGIYTLDPEIKADGKKINGLNIVFSLVALALLVLI